MNKQELRAQYLALRTQAEPDASLRIAARLLDYVAGISFQTIAGYYPMRGEADIIPVLERLAEAGKSIALPVMPERPGPLAFHPWRPGEALTKNTRGVMEPRAGVAIIPQVVLVPLVAFDRRGHRLGYGGGYYDRTLTALPGVRSIGVAFAAQEAERIPDAEHDAVLDAVITENDVIPCARPGSPLSRG